MPHSNDELTQEEMQNRMKRYLRAVENTRDQIEGNPLGAVFSLAGDIEMQTRDGQQGFQKGFLDAIARGVLKEAGYSGRRYVDRQKRLKAMMDEAKEKVLEQFHEEFKEYPDASELVYYNAHDLQGVLQVFAKNEYSEKWEELMGDMLKVEGEAEAQVKALGGASDTDRAYM